MNRCPRGDFYVVATWYHGDTERYCQWNIPSGSYLETMKLVKQIYTKGLDGLGRPHSISIEPVATKKHKI